MVPRMRLEERLGLLHEPVVDGADGDDVVFDSEIVGQGHRVIDGVDGGPGGGHEDAGDIVLAQGLCRQSRHYRRVQAPGETQHGPGHPRLSEEVPDGADDAAVYVPDVRTRMHR